MGTSCFVRLIASLCLVTLLSEVNASSVYDRLMRYVKDNTDADVIPMRSSNEPIDLRVSMSLKNILEVDTDRHVIDALVWPMYSWNSGIKWVPSMFGNLSRIEIPAKYLWVPDVTLYNAVNELKELSPFVVSLSSDGGVIWVPSQRIRFSCDMTNQDISQNVTCNLKLGSWMYNAAQLNLKQPTVDTSDYFTGSKYEILNIQGKTNLKIYACCPEAYPDVTFKVSLKKKEATSGSLDV